MFLSVDVSRSRKKRQLAQEDGSAEADERVGDHMLPEEIEEFIHKFKDDGPVTATEVRRVRT